MWERAGQGLLEQPAGAAGRGFEGAGEGTR